MVRSNSAVNLYAQWRQRAVPAPFPDGLGRLLLRPLAVHR